MLGTTSSQRNRPARRPSEEAVKGKATASQLYSAALAKAAEPSLVQQLATYLETNGKPPASSSNRQLYDAWNALLGKKQTNKKAFEEAIKGKDTASQLYSAALEKADAAKAKKGANAKSK